MADNFPVNDSSSTPHSILTDELSTLNGGDVSASSPRIHAQRVKIMVGTDGAANDVSSTNPFSIASADGALASIGALADAEATANGSVIAVLKRIRTLLGSALPAGSNNIGSVDIDSLPAADRATDSLVATLSTDGIATGSLATTGIVIHPPKFKTTSVAASQTDQSVISSVASKKLRVLQAFIQCGSTATDITFESDDPTTDTTLWKATLAANGGAVLPFSPVGWFETDISEALIATTTAGSTVQVVLAYIEV